MNKKGVSLIEIIVYVALLGGISVFIANSLIHITNAYHRARAEREVISNARLLLEAINKSVSQAQAVYAPTSRFDDDAGQLSLVTVIGADPEHETAYLDYYVDNGRLYRRAEGENETPLSASTVRISKFRLERIVQSTNREAVRVTLEAQYALPKFAASIILNSTTALRGNY